MPTSPGALRIGVPLPTVHGLSSGDGTPDIVAAGRLAEELALESVWAADHLVPVVPILDSTVALSMVAAETKRLRLGFSVMVLALRQTAWAAKQLATMQLLSGDRVVLGVGSGGAMHGADGWAAAGLPYDQRGLRTDAALAALPTLLAGEPTRLGHEAGSPEVTLSPAAAMPPVLIGGNGRVAIRRAAAFGDGWFPAALTPAALAAGLAQLRELAAQRGRPAPTCTVGVPTLHDTDPRARETLVQDLVDGYGVAAEDAPQVGAVGTPAQIADQLAGYAAAGADRVVLMASDGDWRACYHKAGEVVAALSG